jgi:hypothetical protein
MTPLLLALQLAATVPVAPAVPPAPDRFSILVPVAGAPCRPSPGAPPARPGDVTVCADGLPDQTVPLPGDYVYDTPRPSNPQLTGTGALAAQGTPCATLQGGCQVGFGAPVVQALLNGAIGLVKDATRKRYPKQGRVAIPLDGPLPGYRTPPPAPLTAAPLTAGSASTSAPSRTGSANP